jgi:hypothetical protein
VNVSNVDTRAEAKAEAGPICGRYWTANVSPSSEAGLLWFGLDLCPKDLMMSVERYSRRRFNSLVASAPLWGMASRAFAAPTRELPITRTGAVADNSTINTKAIQAAIDQLAAKGGGTVVVPKGLERCSSNRRCICG